MISLEEERLISNMAYVPEHVLNLMVPISKGEPTLLDGYIYFSKDDWVVFVGYPLGHDFKVDDLERLLSDVIKKRHPKYLWLIAPEIPKSFVSFCNKRESDYYYKLELTGLKIKKDLIRLIKKASQQVIIEKGKGISKEHMKLISGFLERIKPSPLIRELFLSMQEYVNQSETAVVLNAINKKGKLTAFYVVETAAKEFAIYVIGCYSKENYVPYASDLLFSEMINLAKSHNKSYIHLGIGVNEGIKRFKEKWGGIPFLKYELCEYKLSDAYSEIFNLMKALKL